MSSTRCRILAVLSDTEWRRTREVADLAGVSTPLAIDHLKRLERDGLAVSRGRPRLIEWRWVPGGWPHETLICDSADVSYGLPS